MTAPDHYRMVGGRRHFNFMRRFRAAERQVEVARLLREMGGKYGWQTEVARKLGVSTSTINRDHNALLRRWRESQEADSLDSKVERLALERALREIEAWKAETSENDIN